MPIRLLGLIVFCLCLAGVSAQQLPASAQFEMAVLQHDTGTADTIAAVAVAAPALFKPLPGGVLAEGYSRAPEWVRLNVQAPASEWWLDILPGNLDDLRFFEPDPSHPGQFLERRAGDLLPFAAREVAYRGFVFKLHYPQSGSHTYYLRLSTTSSVVLAPRLQSPDAFHAAATLEFGLLLAITGSVLAVAVLMLIGWLWSRDDVTAWLLLYIASMSALFLGHSGIIAQYFFPQAPVLADSGFGFFTLLSIAFGNRFYQRLFSIDSKRRVLYPLYTVSFWFPLLGIASLFSGHYVEVVRLAMGLVFFLSFVAAWLSFRWWRDGEPGGGALLAANIFSLVGIAAAASGLLGLQQERFAVLYAMNAASIGAIVALHAGLGARRRMLRETATRALADLTHKQETLKRQTEFFAMLSHELKTPLAMIDGAVQSLQLLAPAQPEIERRHERIRRAVGRINELLQKFLMRSHLDHPDPPLQKRNLALDQLVLETVAGFALDKERLVLDLAPQLNVHGDEAMLKVLISNLVDNALKYSPPQGALCISLRRRSELALLEVRDQGSGVAPELQARLFDSYVRGSKVGDIPGAGLGLFLVRKIARLHGGDVELLPPSATWQGAAFCVSMTIVQEKT